MPSEKKIFLFVRNTLLNKCHLKLLFLYAPMRNICKYCNRAALFEPVCYARTSEQGLEGWWGYSLYVRTCLLLWKPSKPSQVIRWQKLPFALERQRLWYLAAKISICSVIAEQSGVSAEQAAQLPPPRAAERILPSRRQRRWGGCTPRSHQNMVPQPFLHVFNLLLKSR